MDLIDFGMYAAYLFFGVGLIAAVVLPLISALKSPAGMVKSLIAIGGLVVLFFVSYSIAGGNVSAKAASLGITETSSKLIGAGITLFFVVFVVAALGIVVSEINKAIK